MQLWKDLLTPIRVKKSWCHSLLALTRSIIYVYPFNRHFILCFSFPTLSHTHTHTHTHTHMSTGSTKYNFMYIHGYKLKGRKIRGPRRFDFSPYSISSDVTKTVKIIYCKMPRILFALNVTSAVMMEVSGHLNSQAALPLAVVNPISGG